MAGFVGIRTVVNGNEFQVQIDGSKMRRGGDAGLMQD